MVRAILNAKLIGEKPFNTELTLGPYTKKMRPTLYDKDGWFMDYLSFNGNSKQRRQQRRKLLKELNQ